jgi:hypothetical protein
VHGRLARKERLVLVSDGIPEARSHTGELYGFERLSILTQLTAQEIAGAAQAFGQDDDITVLTPRDRCQLKQTPHRLDLCKSRSREGWWFPDSIIRHKSADSVLIYDRKHELRHYLAVPAVDSQLLRIG